MKRPRVFIASSKEAEPVANAVIHNLKDCADPTPWWYAFTVGASFVDELLRNLAESDFGIFVFHPDDELKIRELKTAATRDNVVLELGMFLGKLGKEKSFIVSPSGVDLRLPTDLAGITVATYDMERVKKDEAREELVSACDDIKRAIRKQIAKSTSQAAKANARLNGLVRASLETVCRALSVPVTPEQVSLRAFIFRKEDEELVCSHYWDPNPSDEEVGVTRFKIAPEVAKDVVVVRCFQDKKLRSSGSDEKSTASGVVRPLPPGLSGVGGRVKPELTYVLAAPIRDDSGTIWGVVDFDTSKMKGEKILKSECAHSSILALSRQLTNMLTEI